MTALTFMEKYVSFRMNGTPITGPFDIRKYRFLQRPIESLDNPDYRRTVVLKASGCMGTVFLQMAITYRTARKHGDEMTVTMTDDYAKKWTKTRGKPFILKNPEVARLIRTETGANEAITNDLWQFVHKSVYVNGPGATKSEGTQLVYLSTDESHLEEAYPPGTLVKFEKRVGTKWNGNCLHTSTAPSAGRELAEFWLASSQDEFHHRCLKCGELVWLIWPDESDIAEKYYNGEKVFHWRELPSETMTNESLRFVCPHCQHEEKDGDITRFEMQDHGDYLTTAKEPSIERKGYRWSCLAAPWLKWESTLSEWRKSLNSERMGNFEDMESFIKRWLCMIYFPRIHGGGSGRGNRDYKLKDAGSHVRVIDEPVKQFALIDVQDAPLHFWALCTRANRKGETRRIAYCKLESWGQAKAFADEYFIKPYDVGIDIQHRFAETIAKCSENGWYGLQNARGPFMRTIGGTLFPNPFFSDPIEQDAFLGKSIPKEIAMNRKKIFASNPRNLRLPGFAGVIQWNKERVGFTLMALKSGEWGRYFGVPEDVDEVMPEYLKQLNSYGPSKDRDKKTGAEVITLRQLNDDDHAFVMECQAIVMQARAGYFPLDFSAEKAIEVTA